MKLIGLLGFDEVAGLDLVGPLEAFANAAFAVSAFAVTK